MPADPTANPQAIGIFVGQRKLKNTRSAKFTEVATDSNVKLIATQISVTVSSGAWERVRRLSRLASPI